MKTSPFANQLVPVAAPPAAPEAFRFGPFRLPSEVDLLFRGDTVVPLEPRAVCVLRHLVRQAGRVVGKEELLDEVWTETFVSDGVLKKAVSQIRRALDDPPQQSRFVETWHRRGYRFVAPVEHTGQDLGVASLGGRESELEALFAEYRRALARLATPAARLKRSARPSPYGSGRSDRRRAALWSSYDHSRDRRNTPPPGFL